MANEAQDLVNLIQKMIDEALAVRDRTQPCVVKVVNADGTLDVSLPPDNINTLHKIINTSGHSFVPGDVGLLYLVGGKTSNAFVISKNNAKTVDKSL